MSTSPLESFPLAWPLGRHRIPATKRKSALFNSQGRALTISAAINRLRETTDKLKATGLVISSNLQLRRDGLPHGGRAEPSDPGVAVYFSIFRSLKNTSYVVACDKWDRTADNIAAIAAHLEAMRGQDRWGCGSLEQAFAGYKALAAADAMKAWWHVLGFESPPARWVTVEAKHLEMVRQHHPDRGGNSSQMAEINAARDEAKRFYNEVPL